MNSLKKIWSQVSPNFMANEQTIPGKDFVDFSGLNATSTISGWAKLNRKVDLRPRDGKDLLLNGVEKKDKLRFVCISDTHNKHEKILLPEGDVLLHTGDMTMTGSVRELESFNDWLGQQPFEHKIVIAGNHDMGLDCDEQKRRGRPLVDGHSVLSNCTYLLDEAVHVHGYKIYGSPWVPTFGYWAFMLNRHKIKEKWEQIPSDTDILLTHGPPLGILDKCRSGDLAGCMHLLDQVINRVRPKFHIFGHIHEDNGIKYCPKWDTTFINASSCTLMYTADNHPVVFELPKLQHIFNGDEPEECNLLNSP